jgi:energy-coupling factor transporter ATP-binding protein EcfA2
MPLSLPLAWWGPPWVAPRRLTVTQLIAGGVLDPELAALLWLLLDGRVPIVVAAGPRGAGKSTFLAAFLELLPADADVRVVLGPEPDLAWLPEASALGWRAGAERDTAGTVARDDAPVSMSSPSRTVLASPELSGHLPWYAWGTLARVLVRAASLGYGLATTLHAERLEDVMDSLQAPPVSLTSDELGHLGVVVILRAMEPAGGSAAPRRRVVAAHLLRPPSRDALGHVQRLGPAVLAARDERRDGLEHYAWGVMPEIAARLGRRAGDLELAQARRASLLRELVAAARLDAASQAEAILAYREEHAGDSSA